MDNMWSVGISIVRWIRFGGVWQIGYSLGCIKRNGV